MSIVFDKLKKSVPKRRVRIGLRIKRPLRDEVLWHFGTVFCSAVALMSID